MATRDRGGWTRRTPLGMVYGDPDYHYPPLRGRVERFQVIPDYSGSSGACTHTDLKDTYHISMHVEQI